VVDVGQMPAGILQARALELLPQDEFRPRAFVCYHLANILSWQGDATAGLKALEEAVALSLSAGDLELAMTAQFEIANMLRYQGKLKQSMRMFEQTHQLSATHVPERKLKPLPVGFAYLQQARIYLEWNDLDETLHFAREGIRICKLWGYSDYLYEGWITLAGILYETGDLDGALAAIGEAKQIFPIPEYRLRQL
jgi:ATP/maltotriose-dependent transcriptional regulator MalT